METEKWTNFFIKYNSNQYICPNFRKKSGAVLKIFSPKFLWQAFLCKICMFIIALNLSSITIHKKQIKGKMNMIQYFVNDLLPELLFVTLKFFIVWTLFICCVVSKSLTLCDFPFLCICRWCNGKDRHVTWCSSTNQPRTLTTCGWHCLRGRFMKHVCRTSVVCW